MWLLAMLVLCLIAAMAGGPLRQAEAAADLERSLAELDGGDVIESVDGGVGDDAGETILDAGGRRPAVAMSDLPAIDGIPCPPLSTPAFPSADGDNSCSPRTTRRHAVLRSRRHAWPQDFRF
jgi:hypothetical protein